MKMFLLSLSTQKNPPGLKSMLAVTDIQCAPMITTEDITMSFEQNCTDDEEIDDIGDPLPKVSVQQANVAY